MEHMRAFEKRKIIQLPNAESNDGWILKRYAILPEHKALDDDVISKAFEVGTKQLPPAGTLEEPVGNHGVGFQVIHFAETAIVSPLFYWMWGNVLANAEQIKAQWDTPTEFKPGMREIIGCVWELDIVCFETQAWIQTMLNEVKLPKERLHRYMNYPFFQQ